MSDTKPTEQTKIKLANDAKVDVSPYGVVIEFKAFGEEITNVGMSREHALALYFLLRDTLLKEYV